MAVLPSATLVSNIVVLSCSVEDTHLNTQVGLIFRELIRQCDWVENTQDHKPRLTENAYTPVDNISKKPYYASEMT
jgi:hypothetical protein